MHKMLLSHQQRVSKTFSKGKQAIASFSDTTLQRIRLQVVCNFGDSGDGISRARKKPASFAGAHFHAQVYFAGIAKGRDYSQFKLEKVGPTLSSINSLPPWPPTAKKKYGYFGLLNCY